MQTEAGELIPSMPFQKKVYYPLAGGPGSPVIPTAPAANAAGAAAMAYIPSTAASGPLPFFQFRPRLESVDRRWLSAIDVDKVAGAVDILTLQENIMNITFCKVEDEKCPHCHLGVDPVLLKLIRLAQLTIEYLLHSQEFLTEQLHSLEEQLRLSLTDYDQSKKLVIKQVEEIKLLKDECKRREEVISTQQLIIDAKGSYYQCHFCDKAFMNQAFLQSHIQGCHLEDSHLENKKKVQTDKLQGGTDLLKEQLQLTHAVRFSKEYERQKTKEEEFLQLFHRWKEEKEKPIDEMEKVEEMFMKEFKELTSKNSALENQFSEIQKSNMLQIKSDTGTINDAHEFKEDCPQYLQDFQNVMQLIDSQESKWTAQAQALHQEHKKQEANGQLLSHREKLRITMIDELNASNVLYKKIEELGQTLQEENELIITQRQQIKEFTSKPLNNVSEPKGALLTWQTLESKPAVPMNSPVPQTLDAKSSLTVAHVRKNKQKLNNNKIHLRKALKTKSSLTEEIRTVLEQSLVEKLETLGIGADTRGIASDHLDRVLRTVELARQEKERQIANSKQIREFLVHKVSCKTEERMLLSSDKYGVSQVDSFSTGKIPKAVELPQQSRHLARQRPVFTDRTFAPKIRENFLEDNFPRKSPTIITPLFSSEGELDDDHLIQAYTSPELLLPVQPSNNNKNSFGKSTAKSDTDWTEGSEIEVSDISFKPAGTSIKTITEEVEKTVLNHRNINKSVGGINVA